MICTDQMRLEEVHDAEGLELIALAMALVRSLGVQRIHTERPVGGRDARREGSEAHVRVRLKGEAAAIRDLLALSFGQL